MSFAETISGPENQALEAVTSPLEANPFIDIAAPALEHKRPIPHRQLQSLHNITELPYFQFMKMGPGRQFYDVVVVKASFKLKTGLAELAPEPAQIIYADEFWDDEAAELSSLKHASDLVLFKPFSDVYVTGHAKHYGAIAVDSWEGMLRVKREQTVLVNKVLRFCGPRQWAHSSGDVWRLNKPQPTTQVPLRYELAYGGSWFDSKEKDLELATVMHEANPSGSGFFGKGHDKKAKYPGVQIEAIANQIRYSNDADMPIGWGAIARSWSPRVERQGTYDDAWKQDFLSNEFADYPKDFDLSYFNCAPQDQMISMIQGHEQIGLAGVFSELEAVNFQLPSWQIKAICIDKHGEFSKRWMRCDTLHIDLDAQRVNVTWRLSLLHALNIYGVALNLVSSETNL